MLTIIEDKNFLRSSKHMCGIMHCEVSTHLVTNATVLYMKNVYILSSLLAVLLHQAPILGTNWYE